MRGNARERKGLHAAGPRPEHPMRPQSEIRVTLAAALLDGPGTTRELAQRTGWAIGTTRTALDNMVRSGDAVVARTVRMRGVKRPVPVYQRAVRAIDLQGASTEPLISLIAAWVRAPSPAGVVSVREAAM